MTTLSASTVKYQDPIISKFNNNSAQKSSYNWVKRDRKSVANETGIRFSEYGQAIAHTLRKREIMGGVYIGLSIIQKDVIGTLVQLDKISKIYLDHYTNKDNYIIITEKEYEMFSLELADIYWDLFDRIQLTAASYSFEFEHFNANEVPPQTERMKEMYSRGN